MVTTWGILEVSSGGTLQVRRGQDITRYVVPAPESVEPDDEGLIRGDGYTLQLNEGWTLRKIGRKGNYIAREK